MNTMRRTHLTRAGALALAITILGVAGAPARAVGPAPQANLYVSSFQLVQSAGRWSLTVGIGNSGPGPLASAPCSLKMVRYTPTTILGRPGYMISTVTKSVPAVPAFTIDYVTVTFDLGTAAPDGYATFTVDSGHVVAETDETDNTQTYYFP